VDSGEKWCDSSLPKIGVFNRADEQDSTNLTIKVAKIGLSSRTDSVSGPSMVGMGQGRKAGCLLHLASGTWALERGEAVTRVPLKAAAVSPHASPCSHCHGCQPRAGLQKNGDVNQL